MTDYATTGDGLMAGLQFLAEMVRTGRPASDLLRQFEPVPQLLKNVRFVAGSEPLEHDRVKAAIAEAEARLEGTGRLADPQVRNRAADPRDGRSEDDTLMRTVVEQVADAVQSAGAVRSATSS